MKNIIQKSILDRLSSDITTMRGSKSITEHIIESMVARLSGKSVPKYSGSSSSGKEVIAKEVKKRDRKKKKWLKNNGRVHLRYKS